ncbi:MAG: hypothetical protein GMKNLPBB_00470 [Myxococcota bacterium]|nr:hypothetical protein [Myxococcota bacterium]
MSEIKQTKFSPEDKGRKGKIHDVIVKPLRVIPDERGRLMEILRVDDEQFPQFKFGQVYMTTQYPGVTKAWHYHLKQDDYMTCVHGMVKLVLYDDREESPTRGVIQEIFVGVHHPVLVYIPRRVYHGWKGVSEFEAIVVNTVTEVYDYKNPDEFRVDPHTGGIPYDWSRKDG